jgi:N-sulfoglucosamine sulfohydrolase
MVFPPVLLRVFLRAIAPSRSPLFLTFILITSVTRAAEPSTRPSILFAIADDWSFPHAGAYGDTVVHTTTFDRVAAEGVLFTRAFCVSPSCSPSRAAILTGQPPHRLEAGANLWGTLPAKFAVYPDALEAAGYHVGFMGKGWAPGHLVDRKRNPAGPAFKSFEEFFKTLPQGEPFCFWYGSHDPHRPYKEGQGVESGLKPEDVKVPPYLPDSPQTRGDILDYYFAVERFNKDTGHILDVLQSAGRLDNTIVVMTSDNGWPFPRAKTNLYDSGTHMPLAIRWPAGATGGRKVDALISQIDFAPTFLEAAGVDAKAMPDMAGHSFLSLVTEHAAAATTKSAEPEAVFFERERHANVRQGDVGYPVRAIRTDHFLYIRNLTPDRWPAGDPKLWKAVGPFGDIDPGPTKDFLLAHRDDSDFGPLFNLACGKRPEEELYDLDKDPGQLHSVAEYPDYAGQKKALRARLDDWMKRTDDPRATFGADYKKFDQYDYFGGADIGLGAAPKTRPAATKPAR